MNNKKEITIQDVAVFLNKYHQNYKFLGKDAIKLYSNYDNSYTVIDIADDHESVTYEGRVIGGLAELKKRLF